MGKRFSPAYANIFMAEWEYSALQSWVSGYLGNQIALGGGF